MDEKLKDLCRRLLDDGTDPLLVAEVAVFLAVNVNSHRDVVDEERRARSRERSRLSMQRLRERRRTLADDAEDVNVNLPVSSWR